MEVSMYMACLSRVLVKLLHETPIGTNPSIFAFKFIGLK